MRQRGEVNSGRWAAMALAAYAGAAVALGGGRGALGQSPGPGLASSEGERVEQYIERLGLHELLAEHLRQRMADRTSSEARERARVAERLARLYAQMLSETTDPGKRAEIIAHGTELLRAGIGGRGFGLRLTLARERYRPAEELAERWRIGLVGEAERAGAVAELRAVRAQLAALSSEVARREREVSAALDNATAADPVALDNERRELLGFRVQADYYTAWCAYYAGLLGASPEATVEAVALFCRVLRVPSEKPTPEGFRTESFADEGLARSAVGLALSLGLAQKTTPASAWLDALEGEAATPPGVREGLLGWRIAVLAGGERWADLDRAIRQSREGKDGGPLSVVEARQLIELAQRATREGKDAGIATLAGGLMRLALEDLVTRRELAHVLELVREIGPDALGEGGMTRGFVGVYVMGRRAGVNPRDRQRVCGRGATAQQRHRAGRRELFPARRAPGAALQRARAVHGRATARGGRALRPRGRGGQEGRRRHRGRGVPVAGGRRARRRVAA
jgi:hypothetical protein